MVGERELWGEGRGPGERGVLPRDVLGPRAQQDEHVDDASLRHPVGVDARLGAEMYGNIFKNRTSIILIRF